MSILREIFAKIGLDVDAQSFAKGDLAASAVKATMEKLVETAKEVAEAFVETFKSTAEYGEEMIRLSETTGTSTTLLQQLGAAAKVHGLDIDTLGRSLVMLSRTMYETTQSATGEQAKAFKDLGVKATDASGKLRPLNDVLLDVADKFKTMPDGAEKTALAMELFSRAGAGMIELLNEGRAGLQDYLDLPVLSREQLEAGKAVVETQNALKEETAALIRVGVAPLMPIVKDLLRLFLDWEKANAKLIQQKITEYLGKVVKVATTMLDIFKRGVTVIQAFATEWKAFAAATLISIGYLIAANATLASWYAAAGIAAVVAAGQAAFAWGVAAAPFVALFALVVGLKNLFADLQTYNDEAAKGISTHNTFFGRLKEHLAKWEAEAMKSKGPKPFWLSALEDAVATLEHIRQLMIEVGYLDADSKANQNDPTLPGKRVAGRPDLRDMGKGGTYSWQQLQEIRDNPTGIDARYYRARQAGAGWFGATEAQFGRGKYADAARYDPARGAFNQRSFSPAELPGSGPLYSSMPPQYTPASGAISVTNNVTMDIHPSPGMDEAKLGDHIVRHVRRLGVITQGHVDAAHAAAGS